MMKYDILILTPVPSFYKLNLFNEISKEKKIFVVFTGEERIKRNDDFSKGEYNFDYLFLDNKGWRKIYNFYRFYLDVRFDKVIVSGWDSLLSWFIIFFVNSKRISCIVESSIFESSVKGFTSILKRFFLKKVGTVLASGIPQEKLVTALGFEKKVVKFGGCGLLNYVKQPTYKEKTEVKKFLYVGRFSPEKNLILLIEAFNKLPNLKLDIVGFGSLENHLKKIANSNITFWGAIDNKNLSSFYQKFDVFILPSRAEPWGLVVEEALNNGLPVIVSDRVGCKEDLVSSKYGLIFKFDDLDDLVNKIIEISNPQVYNKIASNISKLDFFKRAEKQVYSFINI